jgi:hypothetical protein
MPGGNSDAGKLGASDHRMLTASELHQPGCPLEVS